MEQTSSDESSVDEDISKEPPNNVEVYGLGTGSPLFPAFNISTKLVKTYQGDPEDNERMDISPEIVSDDQPQLSSLFPAYGVYKAQPTKETASPNFDWLRNDSFTPTAAKVAESLSKIRSEERIPGAPKTEKVQSRPVQKIEKQDSEKKPKIVEPPNKTFIEETGLKPENAFRVDRTKDPENFIYDSFYKTDVARYKQCHVPPLGLPKDMREKWISLEKKSQKKRKKDASQRYFSRKSLSQYRKPAENISTENKSTKPVRYYFIPLSTDSKSNSNEREFRSDNNPLGILDKATSLYISGKPNSPKQEFEPKENTGYGKSHLEQKTEWYNKNLRKDPGNEQMWLDFVQFQDEINLVDLYEGENISSEKQAKLVLEKKLAILDRAVSNNPRSIELANERLQIGSEFWDWTRLSEEWKKLTFLHAGNPEIWNGYISFLKSSLTAFTVPSVVKGYTRAISKLYNVLIGKFNVITPVEHLEEKLLALFYDLAAFLWNSGYTERALGIFQAMLEFNLFAPALPEDINLQDRKTFFEPFWDSGAARVGEQDAQGWESVMAKKEISDLSTVGFADLNEAEDTIIQNDLKRNETWLQFEKLREINHWLPWRPSIRDDSEECEDPERMVMVDDVTPMLFLVCSEESKLSLVLHFLHFLGVSVRTWNNNNYVSENLCSVVNANQKVLSVPKFCKIELPNNVEPNNLVAFVLRVIEQVRCKFSDEIKKKLDVIKVSYYINVSLLVCAESERDNALKSLKKFVRSSLKDVINRNNVELWVEFATLQWVSGAQEEAFKVYDTILSSMLDLKRSNVDVFRLVLEAIRMVMGLHKLKDIHNCNGENAKDELVQYRTRFLWYLSHLGAGERLIDAKEKNPSNGLICRAKKGFEVIVNENLSKLQNNECLATDGDEQPFLTLTTVCSAYFNYFLNGLNAGLAVFENTLKEDLLRKSEQEFLFESQLQMIRLESVSSLILRPVLIRALENSPTNLQLLAALISLDTSSYLSTRRRRYLSNLLKNSSVKREVPIWVLAIVSEWQLLQRVSQLESGNLEIPQVGISWKIRSLFEKALSTPPVMYSAVLWRMYMKFEIEQGQYNKARAVFYKSLQKCPGHKLLYMDASLYFPANLEESCDLMLEKQIRLRTPLEEIDLLLKHKAAGPEDDSIDSVQTVDD